MQQLTLFDIPTTLPIEYHPGFLHSTKADALLTHCKALAWQQNEIRMLGKPLQVPRLECMYGVPGASYLYSNSVTLDALPWTPELLNLRDRITAFCGHFFDIVIGNRYRNGQDSIGWHSDDEPSMGYRPAIASISLGCDRDEKYFHSRSYLVPHRKFGEWFEVSKERDDTLSLSLFDALEIEFTGYRPTCNQYLRQSFKLTIENSGLSVEGLFTEGRYSSELYQPLRLLYLGITNLSLLEKIVNFSFQTLPASIGTCRNPQELEDKAWAVCNTAAELLLGQDLFDIEESIARYKGK
ncbi:MAG: alpha-ketoglutarate-dependent dioxygenase AlkB [Nostoc sp. NMS7]|uniref:alpha-ketoglutarate-dependent dioxygenase AlkB family protein n=1 Tax=Nostoc sp. NMS7 TaxID=2815391 RepID=UPI0026009504|nr:alpha-ketoglutarate-dependent dioxygenase AlkB [Nostoc sp. NMS7]MBN3951916.1 alpha-ketoglutarate-dependent dioxygenase AlkB [Nostoc sp. NMS7]